MKAVVMQAARSVFLGVLAAAAAVGLVLAVLAVLGYPAGTVLRQWAVGAAGTPYDLATSLKEACPLLLTGLAVGVAFRCGVLNIGGEGQFIFGAFVALAMTTRWAIGGPAWLTIAVAAACGVVAGALWAGVAAALDRYRDVPLVLSTILLNFIALYVLGIMVTGPLQAPGRGAQSVSVPESLQLPILMEGTDLHLGVPLALVAAAIAWVVQTRTRFGFEILVTGLNPTAAELAGIPVRRRAFAVMLLSGGVAGLGGALQVLGVSHGLTDHPTSYGYAGIAVALLGRLHPMGIVLAALFFGMLERGASYVEKDPALGLPHDIADIVKGVVLLVMLAASVWVLGMRRRGRIAEDAPAAGRRPDHG